MRDGMVDRLKVISDLEEQIAWIRDNDFHKFPGWGHAVLAMRDALALLKEQEPPTDVSISSAIECLLHPQDADDSDMAKAIDTAVRAMRLLKEHEPADPIPTEDDDWICGACNNSVVGTEELDAGGFVPIRFNYCPNCGRAVKWE